MPALRKDRPDAVAFAAALGQLHCHGISPSWNVLYCQARPLTLPTYAFQHQRYWLLPTAGDFSGANTHAMHPLLDTATELAENRGWVFTGRISPRTTMAKRTCRRISRAVPRHRICRASAACR
ncbi:hypothetical protein OIO89_01220 (plasmid) [Mycobacterium ulcerans]|nr:hypothetical protein OIO89_01220 [Mycobacterium ulcerans]